MGAARQLRGAQGPQGGRPCGGGGALESPVGPQLEVGTEAPREAVVTGVRSEVVIPTIADAASEQQPGAGCPVSSRHREPSWRGGRVEEANREAKAGRAGSMSHTQAGGRRNPQLKRPSAPSPSCALSHCLPTLGASGEE